MTGPESQLDRESGASAIFYGGAVRRILRCILVLGVLLIPLVWVSYGLTAAEGFLLGAAISYLNFRWLERAVNSLARAVVEFQSSERGSRLVMRFLIRYLLIALVSYVTFIGWSGAFRGLLWGLCVPVAAMMGEALYEAFSAIRRGV
ncbi:MAG: ATP synthase subunit I [Terriglobales bacterium]